MGRITKQSEIYRNVTKLRVTGIYKRIKYRISVVQSDKTTKKAEFCVDFLLPKWYPNQALNESGMNKPKDLMRLLAGRQKSA